MIRHSTFVRLAVVLGTVATLSACTDEADVLGVQTADPLFASYVALGNSITAGFQSGGINDSTQRESYARLLAQQMETRYAYPSLADPGCIPPIIDFATGARLGGDPTACKFRNPASVTYALNNVAVPGATSFDPIAYSTAASTGLTSFILGGKTQAARALEVNPTFASVWIGNNDVLPAAVSGVLTPLSIGDRVISPGITPQAQFETNFDSLITVLKTAPRLRGGVLIGVVQVSAAPVFFPGRVLFDVPAFKEALDQATGMEIVVAPSCLNSTSLISFSIVSAIRNGEADPIISCEPVPGTLLGEIFVLTQAEQNAVAAAVTAYNNHIQAVANENGWAYFDPNPALLALKGSGCITTVPNLGDLAHPFGECISLDGVHPSGRGHREIVNALINVINTKYSTSLEPVTAP